jgi:hypothetical protein
MWPVRRSVADRETAMWRGSIAPAPTSGSSDVYGM